MAKTLVILNPISGNGNGAKLWASIEAALRQGGLDFDLARTTAPREAVTIAEKAKRDGYETLISVGGDGTTNEIVNGMLRATGEQPCGTLGIIPVGSGNDFLKMLPQPSSPQSKKRRLDWREGVQRIFTGSSHWVDVGKAVCDKPAPGFPTMHYFINALDTGFGAQVAMHAHDFPYLTGTPMYLASVFKTLVKYSVPHVKIQFGGECIEQSSTMIAAANGRCIGGGFWIAPTARNDDGLLDVMIAQGLGRIGILSLLPKVMNGTHIGDPRVQFAHTARLVIESPEPLTIETDGEIPYLDAHRVETEILSKRLRVIA